MPECLHARKKVAEGEIRPGLKFFLIPISRLNHVLRDLYIYCLSHIYHVKQASGQENGLEIAYVTCAMCHRGDLAEYADGRLRKAVGGRTNVTFVGVHVRRTDYAHHLEVSWLLVAVLPADTDTLPPSNANNICIKCTKSTPRYLRQG